MGCWNHYRESWGMSLLYQSGRSVMETACGLNKSNASKFGKCGRIL